MHTERQQEIIEHALDLINELRIQGLTIKNLSKKLGITEPAIYRHFENKIQILIALLDLLKSNTSAIFNMELSSELSSIQKISRMFEKHFQIFSNKPSLTAVVFSEEIFRNEEQLINKISDVIEHNNITLLSIIKEGQQKHEIRTDIDAEQLVLFIMGALRLFVKKWQISNFSFNLEKEGKLLIDSVRLLLQKEN